MITPNKKEFQEIPKTGGRVTLSAVPKSCPDFDPVLLATFTLPPDPEVKRGEVLSAVQEEGANHSGCSKHGREYMNYQEVEVVSGVSLREIWLICKG